jgi:hypothetical protein
LILDVLKITGLIQKKTVLLALLVLYNNLYPQERYFYTNKPYGSEALFNPISLIINGGFDICQLQNYSDKLGNQPYNRQLKNVWKNLTHPSESISIYGWHKFLRSEIFPITFKMDEMNWLPNYSLHLVGGGMMFAKMEEWYAEHKYPLPGLLSSITLMSHHMLNEVIENGTNRGWSVDEIADIYVFDIGGIILFSSPAVKEFFNKELNLSDWSLQATVTIPNGRIHAGQYFAIKWKLPSSNDWSLFSRFGLSPLIGLSKKINTTDNLSMGIGPKQDYLVEVDKNYRQRTIDKLFWHGGIFYDRNNSLLASLIISNTREQSCTLDIYPGIIKFNNFSPGIWTAIGCNGHVSFGLSTSYVLGLGCTNF